MVVNRWCDNAASTHTEITLIARSSANFQVLPTENVPFVFNLDLCMKPDPLLASTTKFVAVDYDKKIYCNLRDRRIYRGFLPPSASSQILT